MVGIAHLRKQMLNYTFPQLVQLVARGYSIITGMPLRGIVSTACIRFACGKTAKDAVSGDILVEKRQLLACKGKGKVF